MKKSIKQIYYVHTGDASEQMKKKLPFRSITNEQYKMLLERIQKSISKFVDETNSMFSDIVSKDFEKLIDGGDIKISDVDEVTDYLLKRLTSVGDLVNYIDDIEYETDEELAVIVTVLESILRKIRKQLPKEIKKLLAIRCAELKIGSVL